VSTQVPRLFAGLVDDAAVFPPGSAALPEAVAAHREHRAAWYAALVGPLLLPASALAGVRTLLHDDEVLDVGVIGDVPLPQLAAVIAELDPRLRVRQIETPVARRGEDPAPGLAALAAVAPDWACAVYAEIPLTGGLLPALDTVAEQRADGLSIAAKFRTGGLAAELFPTPAELAAVICACRDRDLPFKLTAGLHNAVRHVDPETGFTHHGFLNVLAATLRAAAGADAAEVAEALATTDPLLALETARAQRDAARPLWIGYGSCSIVEPLTDLVRLGLIDADHGWEE
jgi:hypothetical protein